MATAGFGTSLYAADPIFIDPDGPGPLAPFLIQSLDIAPTSNLLRQGVTAMNAGAGGTLNSLSHGKTIGFLQPGGGVVTGTGLNTNFELTLVFGFGQRVDAKSGSLAVLSLDAANPTNFFELWSSPVVDANDLAGTGFNNGQRILTGTVLTNSHVINVNSANTVQFDQFPNAASNDWPGVMTVTASGSSSNTTVRVDSVNQAYFPGLIAGDVVQIANYSQTLPFISANPSKLFTAAAGGGAPALVPALGAVNGVNGPDFELQTDFNLVFELSPRQPCLDIQKYTNGHNADLADGGPGPIGADDGPVPQIPVGANVTWTYEVGNCGNTAFASTEISVTDSVPGVTPAFDSELVGNGDAFLDPGEKWLYKATGHALDLAALTPNVDPVVMGCNPTNEPGGDRNTYENIGTVTTNTASDSDPSHYCNLELAEIGDYVWEDLNGNGIQDGEPAEPPIAGVTVELLDCAGNVLDSMQTNAAGEYLFGNLMPGDYKVRFTLPNGYSFTTQDAGLDDTRDSDASPLTGETACTTLVAGESDLTWDAGLIRPAAIGDRVWHDTDRDGIQDGGEQGFSGITVELHACDGQLLASTTTNGNGLYLFSGLTPGNYYVQFIQPNGYEFSPQDEGMNDGLDSDANPATGAAACTSLASGEMDLTWDAGLFVPPTAQLGDYVWEDSNRNGIQDEPNAGVPGVTVELYACNGALLASTTTNANGLYLFSGLLAGDYYVRFIKPAGYDFSPQDQGGDNSQDSDANPMTGATVCTTLTTGESDLTWDAGIWKLMPDIDIEKYTNGHQADGKNDSDVPELVPGSLVTWTYLVTNTGNVAYSAAEVQVTDSVPGVNPVRVVGGSGAFPQVTDDGDGTLMPGEVWEYQATDTVPDLTFAQPGVDPVVLGCRGDGSIQDGDRKTYENLGTVTAGNQTDADYSHFCNPPDPRITIQKLTNGQDADHPNGSDVPHIAPGAMVTWTYIVTNSGNVPFARTDVVVTDNVLTPQGTPLVFVPGAGTDDGDDTLAPGEVWHYVATGTAAALDPVPLPGTPVNPGCRGDDSINPGIRNAYENIGRVVVPGAEAEDPSHYCNPADPQIDIEKYTNGDDADTPTGPEIPVGGTVTWTYVVTNTGNTPLQNVQVVDDKIGAITCPKNALEIGEAMTCTANGIAVVGQYANLGTVTGQSPTGQPVTDNDPSHYFGKPVILPATVGDFVWKDTNRNGLQDGGEPGISGVTVELLACVGGVPGAVVATTTTDANGIYGFTVMPGSYAVRFYNPDAAMLEFTSTGPMGSKDPADSDATSNAAGTEGTTECFTVVSGENDPTWDAGLRKKLTPAIDIEKATNGHDADTPTGPEIPEGDAVIWTYVVTNTGETPLQNVQVVDDKIGAISCPKTSLTVGEVMTCTANGIAVLGQYANLGTVTGQSPTGQPVTDNDPSHYYGKPKHDGGEGCTPGYWKQSQHFGSWTSPYTPNTLFSAVFEDAFPGKTLLQVLSLGGGGLNALGRHTVAALLNAASGGVDYDLTLNDVISKFNAVYPGGDYYKLKSIFEGYNEQGCPLGRDDGTTKTPAVDIVKYTNGNDANTAPGPYIYAGTTVTWTYVVKNTGGVPLLDVTVTDDMGVAVTCPKNTLAVGETMTCSGSGTAISGQYKNIGKVTADTQTGVMVGDSDPSHYYGKTAKVDIEKYTNGEDADVAPGPTLLVGSQVKWTYVVTNKSSDKLRYIKVVDDQGVYVKCPYSELDGGKSMTCTGYGTAVAGQYKNIGTVTATDKEGRTVKDSDPSHYFGKGKVDDDQAQGCTPGYWKQKHHYDSWMGYSSGDYFSSTFENAFPGKTLVQVLGLGGGGLEAMGRHAVAALLNAESNAVNYPLSKAEVIKLFSDAYPGGNYEAVKNKLASYNEGGCPLN